MPLEGDAAATTAIMSRVICMSLSLTFQLSEGCRRYLVIAEYLETGQLSRPLDSGWLMCDYVCCASKQQHKKYINSKQQQARLSALQLFREVHCWRAAGCCCDDGCIALARTRTVQYSTVLYTVQYNLHCQSLAQSEAARSSPLDRESAEQMCNGKTNARETAKWDAPCHTVTQHFGNDRSTALPPPLTSTVNEMMGILRSQKHRHNILP